MRINKYDASEHSKRAFKRAISWYAAQAEEVDKTKRLSAMTISKRVKLEFDGVGPSEATILRYAKMGIAGTSPLKPGIKSDIPEWAYKSLCVAFESYVRINQINSRDGELTMTKLAAKVNEAMGRNYRRKLLNRVLLSTAKDLDASKMEYCEDRRIGWTTFKNISTWFENWEMDLVELGFAFRDDDVKVSIPEEQLNSKEMA